MLVPVTLEKTADGCVQTAHSVAPVTLICKVLQNWRLDLLLHIWQVTFVLKHTNQCNENYLQKVKLSHTCHEGTEGSRGIAALGLSLCVRWRGVVHILLWSLYPGKETWVLIEEEARWARAGRDVSGN